MVNLETDLKKVDKVVEEEGAQHDERRAFEEPHATGQGMKHSKRDEQVIGLVAHVKQLAPHFLRQSLREGDAGLEAE